MKSSTITSQPPGLQLSACSCVPLSVAAYKAYIRVGYIELVFSSLLVVDVYLLQYSDSLSLCRFLATPTEAARFVSLLVPKESQETAANRLCSLHTLLESCQATQVLLVCCDSLSGLLLLYVL